MDSKITFLPGRRHKCWLNACNRVGAHAGWSYVEGTIWIHGAGIDHGWALDEEGNVVECTIPESSDPQGYVPRLIVSHADLLEILQCRRVLPLSSPWGDQ
jgi:hypothetical protein